MQKLSLGALGRELLQRAAGGPGRAGQDPVIVLTVAKIP
jgi:hypothetical protein